MKSVTEFSRFRSERQPISMVTCYDFWSACLLKDTSIDAVLVGDSVAMVMHGHPSTVHADTDMMALHTAAVRRGIGDRFVVADMPFPAHRKGVLPAMDAVDALMKAGASAVKIEGARGHLDIIEHIVGSGVPVMGHLGLTPQSVNQLGGYRVQGKAEAEAHRISEEAMALQEAGVFALVLECVPMELAETITGGLSIPTIGIGSGPSCSGQILVLQDLLGLNREFKPKFLRHYQNGAGDFVDALNRYSDDVKGVRFPTPAESFSHDLARKH